MNSSNVPYTQMKEKEKKYGMLFIKRTERYNMVCSYAW